MLQLFLLKLKSSGYFISVSLQKIVADKESVFRHKITSMPKQGHSHQSKKMKPFLAKMQIHTFIVIRFTHVYKLKLTFVFNKTLTVINLVNELQLIVYNPITFRCNCVRTLPAQVRGIWPVVVSHRLSPGANLRFWYTTSGFADTILSRYQYTVQSNTRYRLQSINVLISFYIGVQVYHNHGSYTNVARGP